MRSIFALLLLIPLSPTLLGAEKVDFAKDIQPILQKYCVGCHTDGDEGGGLNMDSHASILRGGESGPAVTAGEPSSSRLWLMPSGKLDPVMPPEGDEGPNEKELTLLADWIEQGAAGPDGVAPSIRTLRTPKIPMTADTQLPITAIALSDADNRKAVARFGKVQILDGDEVVGTLDDQPGKVNSLQFSGDGSKLLVASGVTGAQGYAAVYSVASGDKVSEMIGHRDTLYAAVFSPNETLVATAGYDRDIVLWDANTGEAVRRLSGHNGAIFDLAFSPDGEVLASACADETVKIWHVETGRRLDTLSQPEGEVYTVEITGDGRFVLAGSGDNRLRVWKLVSKKKPRINPIVATRFIDESPLINFAFTPDGSALVVLCEGGNVKVVRTDTWNQFATLKSLDGFGTDLSVSADGSNVTISLIDGHLVSRRLPRPSSESRETVVRSRPIYLDLGDLTKTDEATLRKNQKSEPSLAASVATHTPLEVTRGVEVSGAIDSSAQSDHYQWRTNANEVWAIDVDAIGSSDFDPIVSILDPSGQPVLRTRLQAVRDSYFTFRGKDSKQVGDFRVFNWQEMNLGDYLYAAGEVTRLWMHPRGPDSGFNVYPGEGNRWTYFGSTHSTHALGEPAYIVRPLEPGQPPMANGLPVFDVYYENDDDPMRLAGKNSRLLFQAPADGHYQVRVTDTTGRGGPDFKYNLRIRAATPGFKPSIKAANGMLRKGTGREFIVRVDRADGFDGPVTFDIPHLPAGVRSNAPITIEAGQRYAVGTIWVDENTPAWEGKISPEAVATATIAGRVVERAVGQVGQFTLGDLPNVIPSVQPIDRDVAEAEDWTLQVRRGETVSARVLIRRKEGFGAEVSFGKENSGRNASQGVYVDNIGLNGLLVLAGMEQREFFLTADPTAVPGKRSFFLTANVDGGVTSHPITVEVLP